MTINCDSHGSKLCHWSNNLWVKVCISFSINTHHVWQTHIRLLIAYKKHNEKAKLIKRKEISPQNGWRSSAATFGDTINSVNLKFSYKQNEIKCWNYSHLSMILPFHVLMTLMKYIGVEVEVKANKVNKRRCSKIAKIKLIL